MTIKFNVVSVHYNNGGFLPDILLLTQAPFSVVLHYYLYFVLFLKKNQNSPRPFLSIPQSGGEKCQCLVSLHGD